MAHLSKFLERELSKGPRRPIPLEQPSICTVTSRDGAEKITIGFHSNGVCFVNLLTLNPSSGRFSPEKHWRRDLDAASARDYLCMRARHLLNARESSRRKSVKQQAYQRG